MDCIFYTFEIKCSRLLCLTVGIIISSNPSFTSSTGKVLTFQRFQIHYPARRKQQSAWLGSSVKPHLRSSRSNIRSKRQATSAVLEAPGPWDTKALSEALLNGQPEIRLITDNPELAPFYDNLSQRCKLRHLSSFNSSAILHSLQMIAWPPDPVYRPEQCVVSLSFSSVFFYQIIPVCISCSSG